MLVRTAWLLSLPRSDAASRLGVKKHREPLVESVEARDGSTVLSISVVASFVASNQVLPSSVLRMVNTAKCTDGLHGARERGEACTRNA